MRRSRPSGTSDAHPRAAGRALGTAHGGHAGVLRIAFTDRGDDRDFVFIFQFQDRKRDGSASNFFRLDNPTGDDA